MNSEDAGGSSELLPVCLQASLYKLHESHPASTALLVAVSGGLDSMALLHACCQLCKAQPDLFPGGIRVIHINHGLSPNADHWQDHCLKACAALGIALVAEQLELGTEIGRSPEEMARQARYEAFSRHLLPNEALLLAHHRDDWAETVLLRLMRGAGPKGLAGIPLSRALGEGVLWRPLLELSRTDLQAYANAAGLVWVEDESNADVSYSRNFLRHQIVPGLRKHWPAWQKSVLRSAALCADADELLQELADRELEKLTEGHADRLLWEILADMSAARQRLLIRIWLQRGTTLTPGWKLVQRIMDEMITAGVDAQPQIRWGQWVIRRYREQLLLINKETDSAELTTSVNDRLPDLPPDGLRWHRLADGRLATLMLPANGTLRLYPVAQGGMCWPEGDCRIKYRRGGERAALAGRPKRALKKILQEAGVPPWIRARTPLLYINGQLAWIPGVGVCEGFRTNGTGWAVTWQVQ